jgi:hypothetical protein
MGDFNSDAPINSDSLGDDDWRFMSRTNEEMDASNPVHQQEHEEFAQMASKAIVAFQRVVMQAPCAGAALALLETIAEMAKGGALLVVMLDAERQAKQAVASAGQSDPNTSLNPALWDGTGLDFGATPA